MEGKEEQKMEGRREEKKIKIKRQEKETTKQMTVPRQPPGAPSRTKNSSKML